jgi:hypothetical protein
VRGRCDGVCGIGDCWMLMYGVGDEVMHAA